MMRSSNFWDGYIFALEVQRNKGSNMREFGNTQYTYTKDQLELLARCIAINDNLPGSLSVFFDTATLEPDCWETIEWFRRAENIKADPDYIRDLFQQPVVPVEVTQAL